MKQKMQLEGDNLRVAKKMLLEVIDILNARGVIYHLEGGTLLGIVRDGDLIPWDKDTDISIPADQVEKFKACIPAIRMKLWRVVTRRAKKDAPAWRAGDYRAFKIKNRSLLFFLSGNLCLDVFVKYVKEPFVYCIAKEKILRVDAKFYRSYEEISYEGRKVKVPNHYEEYLAARYGDWRTPVKEWDVAIHDLTVVSDV